MWIALGICNATLFGGGVRFVVGESSNYSE